MDTSGQGNLRLQLPALSIIFKVDRANINRTPLCNFDSNSFWMHFALYIVIWRQKLVELVKICSPNKLLPMNTYSPRQHSYTGWALYCAYDVGHLLSFCTPLYRRNTAVHCDTKGDLKKCHWTPPMWLNSRLMTKITLQKIFYILQHKEIIFLT